MKSMKDMKKTHGNARSLGFPIVLCMSFAVRFLWAHLLFASLAA